jgi:hypothetical protein
MTSSSYFISTIAEESEPESEETRTTPLESEEFQVLQNQVDHLFDTVDKLAREVSYLKRNTEAGFHWSTYGLFVLLLCSFTHQIHW